MPVPEAAIHKYQRPVFVKDEVRPARQSLVMDSITEAESKKTFPDQQLGTGVLAANTGHHAAANLG